MPVFKGDLPFDWENWQLSGTFYPTKRSVAIPLNAATDDHQEGFVRLALVMPFVLYLKDRGLDAASIVEQLGFSLSQIEEPKAFIHSERLYRLLNDMAECVEDPYLGLHVGESFDLPAWPPFAASFATSRTLVEFLTTFIRLVPREANAVRHQLDILSDRATYRIRRLQNPNVPPHQVSGFAAAVYIRLLRTVAGSNWNPEDVVWECRDLNSVPQRYCGVHVRFHADPGLSLSFPLDWLFEGLQPVGVAGQSLPATSDQDISLIEAIRSALVPALDTRQATESEIAAFLGISRPRLRRALKDKGTTLAREIKRLKIDIAQRRLADGQHSVAAIGLDLGYTDKAHFTRFFKSQTGMTPTMYRQTLGSDGRR